MCLVVLGRHIPQFDLFDILFGDAPVLDPHARLYQRLLTGDRIEVAFNAEEKVEEVGLSDFYQTSAIPALILAQRDQQRGVLSADKAGRLAGTALSMVEDLVAMSQEPPDPGAETEPVAALWRVNVVGGRWELDNCSAEILRHALSATGVQASALGFDDLAPAHIAKTVLKETDCVILCFLDPSPSRASLLHIRRIKRVRRGVKVGVVLWEMPADLRGNVQGARFIPGVAPEKLAEAREIGADFAVTTLKDACLAAAAAHNDSDVRHGG